MTTNGDPAGIGVYLGHGLTTEELLDLFDAEGRLLLETLAQRRLSDDVPFCPGWTLRDLVIHLGYVYRWAAMIVSEAARAASHAHRSPPAPRPRPCR